MPGPDVGGAAGDAVDSVLDFGELRGCLIGAVLVALVPQCGGGRLVVGEFLAEPLLLALILAAGDLLFPQPRLFLSGPLFLLGDFCKVVGSELEFLDPQPVVAAR